MSEDLTCTGCGEYAGSPISTGGKQMTDWCPENDGAYRAEMAAMYPVQNRKRIEELEAKLAKAVEALDEAVYLLAPDEKDMMRQAGVYRVVTTLAELKGQRDE